jgi:hypothetical protein
MGRAPRSRRPQFLTMLRLDEPDLRRTDLIIDLCVLVIWLLAMCFV